MKKKLSKKLALNRETIRRISDSQLAVPAGADVPDGMGPLPGTFVTETCWRLCQGSYIC